MARPLLASSLLLLALPGGCTGNAGASAAFEKLPPEDDLYRYSLVVAERARSLVGPKSYLALYHVGNVHRRFGMEDRALEVYREALELEPTAAEVYHDIGNILSNRNRLQEAVDAYQQSLLCDPSQHGIYTRIGLVLSHAKRFSEAIRALRHEIRRGGATALTHYNLGEAFRQLADPARAVESFRKAIDEDPRMREALWGLFLSLQALGRDDEAAGVLAKFEKIKAEADRREREAKAKKDNLDDQRRHTAATWRDAHALFVAESRQRGDEEARRLRTEAIRATRESLRFDPEQPGAHRLLIEHHHRRGETRKALEAARAAVEALPDDALLHYEAALLILESAPQGTPVPPEVREALELLDRAVELRPELAPAHLQLARAILFRNPASPLLPKAYHHALRALRLSRPPRPIHYDLLAFASFRLGKGNEALRWLEKGIERFPEAAELRERRRLLDERVEEGRGR